ncbi:MAG: Fis family transcriptional regulator [Deltaproteobacteria bacterium RIFCSPLOWO2_12_FULL_44_12]|nr:MAG: Fis family transcriptional regulator [Deltaproteobacteria bacterium RIFCSPHIGHO2_01_FULL_43_49]OGQ15454.1 MAG: Fis family transcriptional regulator [Deltaproteobacteria bacterium RIFCSPHIGHO2_02_FULL_44_53]OGQ29647.1 MAG: Fis family transcriptional regulator [Deltaproteobacteria bacterium RIFCSPHIGHO2_12_FULL_44_21]OGQ32260.1 MAG: Fis family transcriptional regulator [Deltaproteobacteria bacterium RIFCSPLOWO2_01_FULL_45_74]OGQ43903.1 MAG: Fis family transcriptional regulator [Deltaprote
MQHILIVDDEITIRRALEKFLGEMGYKVFAAGDGEEGLKILERNPIDLALVDLVMPKLDGISFIRQMKIMAPETVAIVLTGFGTITSAVEAMKVGAYHYLTKPFELEDIATLVKTALEHKELRSENKALRKQLHEKYRFDSIIGKSDAIQSVFELVEKVADTDSTILILGESGTGKELIAKAIHYNSRRKDKPLVTVNCAAIPEELLETELFGHMKGSFTGAIATKEGRFKAANGGTIFLDEIGDMSPKLQVKLLRVLQERKYEPVGSTQTEEVDVRILAATNQNLEEAVKKGRFREDLYYRLHVIPIQVPALRERMEDIPLLSSHFIQKYNKESNKEVSGVSDKARQIFSHYPWPGNIRELENLMESLVILKSKGEIEEKDLPEKIRGYKTAHKGNTQVNIPDTGLSLRHALSAFENELILKALQKTGWNKNKAATLLKLNRTTLVEKIKKKGLEKVIAKHEN